MIFGFACWAFGYLCTAVFPHFFGSGSCTIYILERTGNFLLTKFSFGIDDWELPLPIMLMMLLVPESNNTCWARLNHVGSLISESHDLPVCMLGAWVPVYRSCSTFLWQWKLHNLHTWANWSFFACQVFLLWHWWLRAPSSDHVDDTARSGIK